MSFARFRSGVNMVPSMKGRFMRVRPSPWLPAIKVVKTTVPTNPQSETLRLFMLDLLPRRLLALHEDALVAALVERERRVDEADVRERLRKVPEGRTGVGVYLLGEEAHVVRVRE